MMAMMLSEALLDRGVLLDVHEGDIYLTDNAYFGPPLGYHPLWSRHHPGATDAITLRRLLSSAGLDCQLETMPAAALYRQLAELQDPTCSQRASRISRRLSIALTDRLHSLPTAQRYRLARLLQADVMLDDHQYNALFSQPHYQQESSGDGWLWRGAELRRFQRMPYSPKVPLAVLDPYIALLIKSLSAVGCASHCSCQGHTRSRGRYGRQPLRIDLDDAINAAWAQYLLEHARQEQPLADLQVTGRLLIEREESLHSPARDLQGVRAQAIQLGRHVYRNRLTLREYRQTWITELAARQP